MSSGSYTVEMLFSQFGKAFLEEIRAIVREEIATALNPAQKTTQSDWMRASDLEKIYKLPAEWFLARGREGLIERAKHGKYVLFNRHDVETFLRSQKGGEHQ